MIHTLLTDPHIHTHTYIHMDTHTYIHMNDTHITDRYSHKYTYIAGTSYIQHIITHVHTSWTFQFAHKSITCIHTYIIRACIHTYTHTSWTFQFVHKSITFVHTDIIYAYIHTYIHTWPTKHSIHGCTSMLTYTHHTKRCKHLLLTFCLNSNKIRLFICMTVSTGPG